MPRIYFDRIGRLGNNIIQYMTACIFRDIFGHELVPYSSMCQNPYEIQDDTPLYEGFRDIVLTNEDYRSILKTHPFAKRDILLHGFFQQSDLLLKFRPKLLEIFTSSNTESISHTVRVCDIVNTKGLASSEEVVLHFRLDDFQSETTSQVLHPSVFLQTLRKLPRPVRIVSQKPNNYAENLYFSIFESFHPVIQHGSLLEDFASLRDATTLLCSNSTFAWCAAFLGHQKKCYIPSIQNSDGQHLDLIRETDTTLSTKFISLLEYPKPAFFQPSAGEHFQTLCDVTILNHEKYEYHRYLESFVPREKLLFLEEEWELKTSLRKARRVFLYQELVQKSLDKMVDFFHDIELIVIHNGDETVPLTVFTQLFEQFPDVHVYLQNNIHDHPRIHSLPMGVQNRMWRKRETFIEYKKESLINEKSVLAFCSWLGQTDPIRKELREFLEQHLFDGLQLGKKMSPQEYETILENSIFSFCPRGNAYDTHRLWETLYASSIPIVVKDPFIDQLQKHFPSLELHVLDSFVQDSYKEQLEQKITKRHSTYIPFCCIFDYWKLLFDSYRRDQE